MSVRFFENERRLFAHERPIVICYQLQSIGFHWEVGGSGHMDRAAYIGSHDPRADIRVINHWQLPPMRKLIWQSFRIYSNKFAFSVLRDELDGEPG